MWKGDDCWMVRESVSLKLGERRRLRVLVENTTGLDCYISSAKYTLTCGDETESSGDCEIERVDTSTTILSALIFPQRSNASYLFNIEYDIGDETYLYSCIVRVCGRCSNVP